jgi:hypothetical protein
MGRDRRRVPEIKGDGATLEFASQTTVERVRAAAA